MIFINNQRIASLAGVNYNQEAIKPGKLVYSRTHMVVDQYPLLATYDPCVLLTSFSDASVTTTMAVKLPANVRCWFSNNVMTNNPRVIALPIGIRLSPDGEKLLEAAITRGRLPERNLVYMNFWRQFPKSKITRNGIYEAFGGVTWVTTEGGFKHVPIAQFYEQIASHPYVISPAGAGPDCHRHWESIMLGSIPIVIRSIATNILEDMPCLILQNWSELNEKRLRAELPALRERFLHPSMQKLDMAYWQGQIQQQVEAL